MLKGWRSLSLGPLHTAIVHTKTDQTLRGMLVEKAKTHLILRPASIAVQDQNGMVSWSKLDGEIVIPLENIDFWQEGVEASLAGLTPELFE